MKAYTHSPAEIFGQQIRYVVPLYQRPYVWNEVDQWQPLWDDVRVVAERVETTPAGYGVPEVTPHFLGAIVLDRLAGPKSHIAAHAVIDGQQRLTTLQLLLNAAHSVVADRGRPVDAAALEDLVRNTSALALDPDHVFKVWPTDRDQSAYRQTMRDDLTAGAEERATAIHRGHAFFVKAVKEWVREVEDPAGPGERLGALTVALREKLRLVVIDLEPGDNAQVIFETLNHRGAPLMAADLIKNLLFQMATAQGLDTDALYAAHWRELDHQYWRERVSQGRRFTPRIDVFMQRWLVMNLKREVPVDRVFTEFRDQVLDRPGADVTDLFSRLAADARVHRSWDSLPESSVPGRFRYRVLDALDTQVFAPVFLWLTRWGTDDLPAVERDAALNALESWLVRRALVRATSKDYNNVAIEMLRSLDAQGPGTAGAAMAAFLARQSAESRYWPDDVRLKQALSDQLVYKSLPRRRLRMVLEALEDASRSYLGEGQLAPKNLTIEHVMPVAWREHWGEGVAHDPGAAEQRDARIHTLGNLTLVTGKLNPTLSNRPWTDSDAVGRGLGDRGKRDHLLQHSQLSLNAELVHTHPERWTDETIEVRTADLIDRIIAVWPGPQDAEQPPMMVHAGRQRAATPPALVPWTADHASIQDAGRLWLTLNVAARELLDTLMALAPDEIAAPDLVQLLDLEGGTAALAGMLPWPTRAAADLGRPLPVSWREGDPSVYWIDADAAEALREGARLATSEDFIATTLGSPAGAPKRRRRGSVPNHIESAFADRPSGIELTVSEIVAEASAEYASGEISAGAVAASLNAGKPTGYEWVPGSAPKRIRRVADVP